ncbi:CinA family protein [Xanthobacteraceae bacterium Astr-EGSB]|uniref:CinA family protein n=1 Tax=Astrobacterium formosum TaxID=3069710 RepID=UPI0027B55FBD|nr:CinA family protein [Xanthobacteraceae bacterium Astr-EGSB]
MSDIRHIEFTRIDEGLVERASAVIQLADTHNKTIVTAESCTGGLLATVLSDAPGAGTRLQGGFVTYTKKQKSAALGISPELLERAGAVCPTVTHAMTLGALAASTADIAVAITGVAGPAKDEDGNPIGYVCIAAATRDGDLLSVERHFGDIGRGAVRYRAVVEALALLGRAIKGD